MLVKSFLSFAAIIVTFDVRAQEFKIKNLTVSEENSKTLYLGINNKFQVSNLTKISNATSKTMQVKFNEDIVEIIPFSIGTEELTFHTNDDIQHVSFTTEKIPDLLLSISGGINNNINKNEFLKAPHFSIETTGLFFKEFILDSTILELNGERFQINKGVLTAKLILAVERAQPGDRIKVDCLRAKNYRTGMMLVKNDNISYTLK